jgi:uncharacterized membrane protein
MPSCRFLLGMLFLYISAFSHAQQITCSNWKFFKAPHHWTSFGASGIDRARSVVGGVSQDPSAITHGFVRESDGTYHYYRVPNSTWTSFLHRSSLGVNVGYYSDPAFMTHGLVFSGTNYVTVDYPGESITELTSINKDGTIIGFHQNPGSGTFSVKNGIFTDINYPGSSSTQATSINDKGVIVGTFYDPNDSTNHGFILRNGAYTRLDNPKADQENGTRLLDLNNSGGIVGWYYVAGIGHSFIYKNGLFADIDPPNANYTLISGINDLGDVVGNTNLPSGYIMFTAHCQ